MTDEQKQENPSVPAAPGYYKDTGSKVTDFLVGFIGYPIIVLLAQFSFGPNLLRKGGELAAWGAAAVALCLTACLTVVAYRLGRKFIAIGILSTLLLPLIAAGSCFLIVLAVSGH